jgi:hypothetical protein
VLKAFDVIKPPKSGRGQNFIEVFTNTTGVKENTPAVLTVY